MKTWTIGIARKSAPQLNAPPEYLACVRRAIPPLPLQVELVQASQDGRCGVQVAT
jgi:hypothetical protein